MKYLFLFLQTQLAFSGVVMLDGKPVEQSRVQQPAPPPPLKRTALANMIQSAITVGYSDKDIKNLDQLEEKAKKTLESIKANLRDNLCGQTAFPFNPYTCNLSQSSCDFGFKSEYCYVQDSLQPCPEGMSRRFARGQLERDFIFCFKNPTRTAPAQEDPVRHNKRNRR